MADSQLTLLTLPPEILWYILKTYFSGVTIKNWDEKFVQDYYFGRCIPSPGVPEPPQSYSVVLTCRLLHRLGIKAMFEFADIDLGTDPGYFLEELSNSIPLHEFKRVILPIIEHERLQTWPWSELKVVKVIDEMPVEPLSQGDVTRKCRKLKDMLDLYKSRDIEITADITLVTIRLPYRLETGRPQRDKMRFVIDANYCLSQIELTHPSDQHVKFLQLALHKIFGYTTLLPG